MWVACSCLLVETVSLFQDVKVSSVVSIIRGDVLDGAVQVVCVVPADEAFDPVACVFDGGEGSLGVVGLVLEGFEEGFGVGVVVADPGP